MKAGTESTSSDAPSPTSVAVTILGSGTGVPWRGRSAPGLVVHTMCGRQVRNALVDPGAGSTQRMVARGYRLEDVSHVLLTHYHPDHTGDLAPFLFALKNPRYGEVGAADPVRLIGPSGLRDLHRGLSRVYGSWIELGNRLRVQEVAPAGAEGAGFFTLGPLEVTAHRVAHTDTSVAYRFESRGGAVFAYSGDTDYCPGIIEAARAADLLILECAFPEGEKRPGHLVPSEAGRIAAAAGVSRVLLTHLYPECWGHDLVSACREYYDGDVALAEDGLTVNI